MPTPRLDSLILVGSLLLAAAPATAQPKRQEGRRELPQVQVADAPTTSVEMAEEPFQLDAVGLSVRFPVGARAETTTFGGQTSVQVIPADSLWLVRIQTPRVPNKTMTALDVAVEAMNQLLGSVSVEDQNGGKLGTFGQVLKKPHEVNLSQTAARFYVWLPNSANSAAVVRGYTVFKTGPDQFCAFDLTTAEPEFAKVQGIYEAMVATATFMDSIELSETRGKLVKAGLNLFKSLSDKDYAELIGDGTDRWERLYRPSKTGSVNDDQEIAYRRVRAWVGKRGDLDPDRTKGTGTAADKRPGYLVQMDARGVDGRTVIDSKATFFMAPDRSEEAWVVRNAIREPKGETLVSSEIGGRTGDSMSITTSTSATPPQTLRPMIQGEGYISGFEAVMLPRLLTRAATPGEYGFYAYQSKAGMIRLRRDVLEQPADKPGVWKLTTRLSEDQKPQVSFYSADGKLLRTELPDGSVWEPIELDRLVQIWRSKGLPTE